MENRTPALRTQVALNADQTVAVDRDYYWLDFDGPVPCPRGVKVQLLGLGGVATYGVYDGNSFWTHWAPLPKVRPAWATRTVTFTPRPPMDDTDMGEPPWHGLSPFTLMVVAACIWPLIEAHAGQSWAWGAAFAIVAAGPYLEGVIEAWRKDRK